MLAATRKALRIKTEGYDDQITALLASAMLDLGVAGVVIPDELNVLVQTACITYVQMHFGQTDDYDRLKRSYDEQKAQLATCTGFTDWLVE